jgi:hypothetical protein
MPVVELFEFPVVEVIADVVADVVADVESGREVWNVLSPAKYTAPAKSLICKRM